MVEARTFSEDKYLSQRNNLCPYWSFDCHSMNSERDGFLTTMVLKAFFLTDNSLSDQLNNKKNKNNPHK